MSSFDFKPEDIIHAREAFLPIIGKKRKPKIDIPVSKAVGKEIKLNDPRVIRAVVERRKKRDVPDDVPDDFLKDDKFIEELKRIL